MSSNYIYLYVKTHNVTGLKYLGKTTKSDPYRYTGSGVYWLRHIKIHGYDVTTDIILKTRDEQEFKEYALRFSVENDIVNSNEWANLILETGTGGDNPLSRTEEARKKSIETRKRNNKTWSNSKEAKDNHRIAAVAFWQSERSKTVKEKRYTGSEKEFLDNFIGPNKPPSHLSLNKGVISCPHCFKTGQTANMHKWHFSRCKQNPNRLFDTDFLIVCCIHCKQELKNSPNFYKNHGENCKLRP